MWDGGMGDNMDQSEALQRFALAFDYFFAHFYGHAFPGDLLMHNLMASIRPLFQRAKRLVDSKRHHNTNNVCLWETYKSINAERDDFPTQQRSQLNKILANPVVQNLFLAYDEVNNYSEDLLPNDFEESNDNVPIKIVNILKGSDPLGATIKVFTNGEIYVARVIAGGAADRCGSIHPGDQILEINNVPVFRKTPEEVLYIVNNCVDGVATFKLVPGRGANEARPERRPDGTHVRAMFDYIGSEDSLQPCRDAALDFQCGDILEVFVGDDPHWFQARVVAHGSLVTNPPSEEDMMVSEMSRLSTDTTRRLPVGIIPSELVLTRHRRYETGLSHYYEPVSALEPGEIRPVVLIGAPFVGRNTLRRQVIASNPLKYAVPIPHTSRPPRPNERNGVDYFFVSRAQMEDWMAAGHFVEFGELNNNLYGTMDQSVFQLMRQGKVPVLSAHPLSLRLLRSALFKPVVVFVEPPNFSLLKQTRLQKRACSSASGLLFTDQDLANIVSCSAQMSAVYIRFSDFKVVNGVLEEAVTELIRVLLDFERLPSWVPTDWLETKGFKNSVC